MHHQEFPKIDQKFKVCKEISLIELKRKKKDISWQGKEKENLLKRRRRKKPQQKYKPISKLHVNKSL